MMMYKFIFLMLLTSFVIKMDVNAQDTQTSLAYKIYRANEKSFHVASVLISGKTDAILIDSQFALGDAYRVVADVLESGKNLKAIYISHGDPDYYFGLSVVTRAFPEVVVYATQPTIEHIKKTYQKKLDYWGAILGKNGPANIVMPQVIPDEGLKLEGQSLEIRGLNGVSSERSFVWIPSIKAIVGGVNIYDRLHLWIADAGTAQKRKEWVKILNEMELLNPEVVIPAHALDSSITDSRAIAFTKAYLEMYEQVYEQANDSKELIAAMQEKYPDAGLDIALQIGAKVAKNEMTW